MLKTITDPKTKERLVFNFGITDNRVTLEFLDPDTAAIVSSVTVKAEKGEVHANLKAQTLTVFEGPLFMYERTSSGSNRRKNGNVNAGGVS